MAGAGGLLTNCRRGCIVSQLVADHFRKHGGQFEGFTHREPTDGEAYFRRQARRRQQ